MAVAGDTAVGDARGVKELGVDALVALAGTLVAREAAFGRAPVEAVVVLQLVERPVVEPQRHVVFRAACLLPALGHGVVDDLRDARAGGVVYGHLRRGAQVVDSLVVLGVVSVVVHKVEVDAVRARCREIEGEVVARGAQAVVAAPCRARRVADAFMAAAVPVCGTSMRALAWDEPLAWVTWKVVAVPAGASFHETVKVTPFWVAVAEWA